MKIGIYSPYLDIGGGGERYFLTIAEFLSAKGETIDIYTNETVDLSHLEKRLGLNLSRVNYQHINFANLDLIRRLFLTARYDTFFFLSDGSIPSSLAKNSILHFQTPFYFSDKPSLIDKIKLRIVNKVICNSNFTKNFIDKTYEVNSLVIYPPVDVQKFSPAKKQKIIISVGRFFAPSHPKKQEVLISVFKKLSLALLKDWKLTLVGVVQKSDETRLDELKRSAAGLPVEFITEIDFDNLVKIYSRAKIYWHAAGFGEDLENHPDRAEHFGITTVEAMASGCVPMVFPAGGQIEIVEEGICGLYWRTPEELARQTIKIIKDQVLFKEISEAAVKRSQLFSKECFYKEIESLL